MVTKAEKEQLIYEIMDLLLPPNAAQTKEIIKIIKGNYNVSEQVITRHIKEARDRIKELANIDREYYLSESIHCLDDLYDKTYQEGKYKDSLEVRKELHKLLGLASPAKSEITIKKEIKEMTDDELLEVINSEE